MSDKFVNLHVQTAFGSILDSIIRVPELFQRCKEIGQPAVAITDHASLFSIMDACKESKKTGVKLIPGIEVNFVNDVTSSKERVKHMVLLAKNEQGYKNLLKLNYEGSVNQKKARTGRFIPRISWEHLEEYGNNLIMLTACGRGIISKHIMDDDPEDAIALLREFSEYFEDIYLEVQAHDYRGDYSDQKHINKTLYELHKKTGLKILATCNTHYVHQEDAKYHDMFLAIGSKKPLSDETRFSYNSNNQMYLKSRKQVVDFFSDDFDANTIDMFCDNTLEIADMCTDPTTYIKWGHPLLPAFDVESADDYDEFLVWNEKKGDPNIAVDKNYLRYRCHKKIFEMFPAKSKKRKIYWDRVRSELSVLEVRDFSSYMLIVGDFIDWARKNNIKSGGRGSACGCLVAYLLDMHTVDPIKYGLIFERFLNLDKDMPDIDTDFSPRGRARVKEYIKEKYGANFVSGISNINILKPKVAIKDIARSLELGGDKSQAWNIANEITKTILSDVWTMDDAIAQFRPFADHLLNFPILKEYGDKLCGLPRDMSTHAGGVVISSMDLTENFPMRVDDKGVVVIQYEKNRCEEVGLIKMDVLGLETLDIISDTIDNIHLFNRKSTINDVTDIPLNDADTYKMLCNGHSKATFQLATSMFSGICKSIKPKNIEEIALINALGRPSSSIDERKAMARRKSGKEAPDPYHPCLKEIFEETYGMAIYEEQLLKLAGKIAGWDLGKADKLRKLTKLKAKGADLARELESDWLSGSMNHSGLTKKEAMNIWNDVIIPFSLYAFNKCLQENQEVMSIDDNGDQVPVEIKNIRPGDMVLSKDEFTGKNIDLKVVGVVNNGIKELYEFKFDDGSVVKCTIDHKFRVTTGAMEPMWKIIEQNLDIVSIVKST